MLQPIYWNSRWHFVWRLWNPCMYWNTLISYNLIKRPKVPFIWKGQVRPKAENCGYTALVSNQSKSLWHIMLAFCARLGLNRTIIGDTLWCMVRINFCASHFGMATYLSATVSLTDIFVHIRANMMLYPSSILRLSSAWFFPRLRREPIL